MRRFKVIVKSKDHYTTSKEKYNFKRIVVVMADTHEEALSKAAELINKA